MSALNQLNVIEHLLGRGLVSAASLLDGDVDVRPLSQRHQNLLVQIENAAGFVVKQGAHEGPTGTLKREAQIYAHLQSKLQASTKPFFPKVHAYDAERDTLIIEAIARSEDLFKYHDRTGLFPISVGSHLGHSLAKLHTYAIGDVPACGTPMALHLHRPELSFLQRASRGTLDLLRLVQDEAVFCDALDQIRDSWANDTFIHCDLKPANVLLHRTPSRRIQGVKIIDWEFAGTGPAAWDVGSVFATYLTMWVSSIPMPQTKDPGRFIDQARYPLPRVQAFMQAFWDSYVATKADASIEEALRMCAARLLHTVFELCQYSLDLTGQMCVLVQLALNILEQPRSAKKHLLGIEASS